ncbi:hypothetical protein [Bosea sp. (in: a-proteobacteria)]|uniref:hypothetical protein n=1 Tax=Bosea sp. (in: a-proteobacteria) TaxID=1871050 RepID=UPI003B3B6909
MDLTAPRAELLAELPPLEEEPLKEEPLSAAEDKMAGAHSRCIACGSIMAGRRRKSPASGERGASGRLP